MKIRHRCARFLSITVGTFGIALASSAETVTVRLKGLYPVHAAWISHVNGKELELLPASFVTDNATTVITAERPDTAIGELAAVAVTETGEIISTNFDDASSVNLESQSRADEILLLKQRYELLSKTSEDLQAAIDLATGRLTQLGVMSNEPLSKPGPSSNDTRAGETRR